MLLRSGISAEQHGPNAKQKNENEEGNQKPKENKDWNRNPLWKNAIWIECAKRHAQKVLEIGFDRWLAESVLSLEMQNLNWEQDQ